MPLLDYIASPGLGTLVHFDPYASLVHWPAESSLMVNNSTVDGGFTATQNKILTSIKATVAATSLLFTLFYLLYIFVRSVVGLSWFFLENYRSSQKAKRLDDLSSTRTLTVVNESWKEYWRRMRLSCLFLSNPLTRILVSLQLAEMMDDAQVMIEVFDLAKYDSLCMIQALIFQYFGFAKLSWSFVVSIWMIWILVLRKTSTLLMYVIMLCYRALALLFAFVGAQQTNDTHTVNSPLYAAFALILHTHRIEIASHVIAWGLPIIVTVVPIITKSYGNLGKFCWIKNDQIGNWLRFGLNYIPLWVIIALTLGMYLFTISWIARTQYATYRGLSSSNRFKKVSMSLTLYIKLVCTCTLCQIGADMILRLCKMF